MTLFLWFSWWELKPSNISNLSILRMECIEINEELIVVDKKKFTVGKILNANRFQANCMPKVAFIFA